MAVTAEQVEVWTQARKFMGETYPAQPTEYMVEVIKNVSIAIFKNGQLCNLFGVGGHAEYGSYNLSYYGKITSITAKGVGIAKTDAGPNGGNCYLYLSQFCSRNWNWDFETAVAQNHEEMMHI